MQETANTKQCRWWNKELKHNYQCTVYGSEYNNESTHVCAPCVTQQVYRLTSCQSIFHWYSGGIVSSGIVRNGFVREYRPTYSTCRQTPVNYDVV